MDAARVFLAGQPSARSIRAAARQLTSAITQLADGMAKKSD
jgi:hypothetical protein